MIVYIRTARTVLGKRGEAKKWAVELTEYINAQYPEARCRLLVPRFGEMNKLYWRAEFEDLVALDAWQQKLAADVGYHELSVHSQELLSQDSIKDKVLTFLA